MEKQLIVFNGGLSTKIASNLIAPNEAIEAINVDLEEGTLKPIKDTLFVENASGEFPYFTAGGYIYNNTTADDRFYVEYANTLYWSNKSYTTSGLMKYVSTDAGVDAVAPVAPNQIAVTDVAGGNLEEGVLYTYCYTFVDSSYLEGVPTVFAEATTTATNKKVEVTINPTNSTSDIVQVRIYRTGGDNPTFNLVGEVDWVTATGSTVFTDNTRDIDVARIELTTFENTPPPSNLDMLIENNGTFWGSVGDRIYFSRTGSPYFWGSLDYVRLDDQCTGLGKIGNSIVAFTKSDMYKIDGFHRDNIFKQKLSYNQGCKEKRSVANVDNYLFWVSDNGICLYDGANVTVVTKNILSWNEFARVGSSTWGDYTDEQYNSGLGFEITYAEAYRDKYYGVYPDGIVIIDTSNGIKASTIQGTDIKSLVPNRSDNVLLFVQDNASQLELHTIYGSSDLAVATWTTGKLMDEGITFTKAYRKVVLSGDIGSINKVTVNIDDIPILEVSNRKEFFLPAGKLGKFIQFKIETNGELTGLRYEYTVHGG